jgi:hypothetical protein
MEVANGNEDEEAEAEERKGQEKIDCPVPEKEAAIVLGNDGGVLEDPVGEVDGMLVDGMSPQELDAFLKVFSEHHNFCVFGHDVCMRLCQLEFHTRCCSISLFSYRYKPLTHHSFFHTQEASTERKVSGVGTGAAVLGGVAGMVVLGPLGAVAGAGVLAYAATREDKVGETARSGGEVSQSLISN